MAEARVSEDQDQFNCPVCLDLLKDPVTIACGHSFCMVCINDCWDQDVQRGIYSCPQCRETFTPRPVLCRNYMLAEMVQKPKKTELQAASLTRCYAGSGDVECDFCTGRKLKAIKSCLVCLASFCETHIRPHYQSPAFKKHTLVKASSRLQQKICSQHEKLTEIFCRTDQSFICYLCIFPSLCVSSGSVDSYSISVHQPASFDGVKKCLSDLRNRIETFCREEMNSVSPHGKSNNTAEITQQQHHSLTLDPNTAHHHLILSEKNRVVTNSRRVQPYSDHPERFDYWLQVLCKESVCRRCYWEVEWSSEGLVSISVSYKDISRKGRGNECGFGRNTQSWSLLCSSNLSFLHNNINTEIPDSPSSRIGVYVDHSAGTLSFYRSDTMTLLHTVHTTFTQPLYAGFWVYGGSTVRLCDPK
uniref:Tripartite motif-containing protein 16-like n=1 Tax=Electrophorus electricus TaxID=8005 RepID=A0A4W4F1N4_ELEEL